MKSAPSTAPVSAGRKLAESAALLRDKLGKMREPTDLDPVFEDIEEYARLVEGNGGQPLAERRILEIGFGARPYRLLAMTSMGLDARGIDVEVPILHGSLGELRDTWERNGMERLAKSVVRHALFDRRERALLRSELERRGYAYQVDPARFEVVDAVEARLPEGSVDLVVSEDVFEHIPPESLRAIVPRMAGWLAPGGLALIRPNVHTGITGGHLVEWNRRSFSLDRARRTPPWGHLRGGSPPPNTYLNRLTRADYRELFSEHFEIVSEHVKIPDLGRELLSPEVARELSGYPEEELFSNQVLFVLSPNR